MEEDDLMVENQTLSNEECRKRVLKYSKTFIVILLPIALFFGLLYSLWAGLLLLLLGGGGGFWKYYQADNQLPYSVTFNEEAAAFNYKSRIVKVIFDDVLDITRLDKVMTKNDTSLILKMKSTKKKIYVCLDKAIADEFERILNSCYRPL